MRFFTSDTHFGHANIIKYSNRPFDSVEEMNEDLIRRWNETVREDDLVFHLGDVALGPWVEWDSILTRLNGYKVLVIGNHDRIFKGMSRKHQERFIEHYNRWFDDYYDNISGDFRLANDLRVNLSHFPYDGDHTDEERYSEFRLPDDGTTLIHGHTHAEFSSQGMDARVSRSRGGTLQIHVGQDAWDYRPVSEDEIIDLIEENA